MSPVSIRTAPTAASTRFTRSAAIYFGRNASSPFFSLKILSECDWRWSVFCSNLVVGALEHLQLVDKEGDSSPIPSLLFSLSLLVCP